MPKRTDGTMELGRVGRRVVEANFEGGAISWTAACCCCAGLKSSLD